MHILNAWMILFWYKLISILNASNSAGACWHQSLLVIISGAGYCEDIVTFHTGLHTQSARIINNILSTISINTGGVSVVSAPLLIPNEPWSSLSSLVEIFRTTSTDHVHTVVSWCICSLRPDTTPGPRSGAGHNQPLSLSSDQIRNSTDLCSILNLVVGKEPDLTNKLMLLHIVTFIVFFCTNMILHNFQRSKPLRKLGSNIIWECRGWGRRMFENIYSCAKKGWGKTINHENF